MNTKDPGHLQAAALTSGEEQAPPGSDGEMNPKADHAEAGPFCVNEPCPRRHRSSCCAQDRSRAEDHNLNGYDAGLSFVL